MCVYCLYCDKSKGIKINFDPVKEKYYILMLSEFEYKQSKSIHLASRFTY